LTHCRCKNPNYSKKNYGDEYESAKQSREPAKFIVNDQGVYYSDGDEKRRIYSRLNIQALVRDKASENWGDY